MEINWTKYLKWREERGLKLADIAIFIGKEPTEISDPFLMGETVSAVMVKFNKAAFVVPEECLE